MQKLAGKRILITGGCGSIGSKLARAALNEQAELVRILDNSEQAIYEMRSQKNDQRLDFTIGNVRDKAELERVLTDIDVVFHTAALKHVGLVERNPYQAVVTNILGTRNVIRASTEAGVSKIVTISTDKASNPFSSMGATKLIAERISIAANKYSGVQTSCVRFGNVAGTRGSVIPTFHQQINNKQSLTVTDPQMTRFVMTPDEAVDFVIDSTEQATGGEVFVKKMPAFKLEDLVSIAKEELAPKCGYSPEEIDVEMVGAGSGERIHEKLISVDEARITSEQEDRFVLYTNSDVLDYTPPCFENSIDGEYTSADATMLSMNELRGLVLESI